MMHERLRIPLDEAMRLALEAAVPLTETEDVAPSEAAGRVLAADVVAALDVPGADRSAMDGYAVRSEDTRTAPWKLRAIGRAHAGEPFSGAVRRGEAVAVATGALVPGGCDTVVRIEDVTVRGEEIHSDRPVEAGRFVFRKGADVRAGDVVARRGTRLGPAQLAGLAAVGTSSCPVFIRPRVGILATGREIRRRGPLSPGDVFDSISEPLAALARQNGCEAEVAEPVPDEREAMERALRAFRGMDAILLSGSTSVGERDFLSGVLGRLGRVVYHGVAVRPGSPLLFGRIDRALVFGLPGFPASAILSAYHIVRPVLRRLAHLSEPVASVEAVLAAPLAAEGPETRLVTVRLRDGRAEPAYRGSSSVTSVSGADGYVLLEPGRALRPGDRVEVIPL